MDENLHHIDELFKSGMEGYEEMPSAGAWEKLDTRLDKHNIVSIRKKYAYLKRIAVALMLLFTAVSMYALLNWHATVSTKTKDITGSSAARHHPEAGKKRKPENAVTGAGTGAQNHDPAAVVPGRPFLPEEQPEKHVLPAPRAQAQVKQADVKTTGTTAGNIAAMPHAQPAKRNVARTGKVSFDLPVPVQTNPSTGGAKEDIFHADEVGVVANTTGRLALQAALVAAPVVPSAYSGDLGTAMVSPLLRGGSVVLNHAAMAPGPVKLSRLSRSPFAATVFFSPDFASGRLVTDRPHNHEESKEEIRKREHDEFSFTTGVLADWALGLNFTLQSGITFTRMEKSIQPKMIFARPNNRGDIQFRYNYSSGYFFIPSQTGARPVNGESASAMASHSTLEYIGIPLALKYVIQKGHFRFNPSLGMSANLLTKEKIVTQVTISSREQYVNTNTNGLKSMYLSGMAGISAEYAISKTFGLSITPTWRYALSSINKEAPVKSYPMSFGIATGIRLQF